MLIWFFPGYIVNFTRHAYKNCLKDKFDIISN